MDTGAIRTLEYTKIIALLTEQCGSQMGKELAGELLPSADFSDVARRIDETAEGLSVLQMAAAVPLGGARDIRALLKKAGLGAILEGNELLEIANTMYAMRRMKYFVRDLESEIPILRELAQQIEIWGQLEQQIERTIDEYGAIRDDASAELMRVRREIKSAQNRVKERLDSILRSAEYQKYFQDVLVTMRGDRYVVPIKQEYRQFFPGLVHDQSASGATLFIEPMAVVNLNNDIKQLALAEQQELTRILKALAAQIAKHAASLLQNCALLAQLDFIFAKAKLAQQMDATMPLMNREGRVSLQKARHPLIPADRVVPIDLELGGTYRTLLITGPNTGGKTVSIKTLGLFALMAQAGLFIPAAPDSRLAVFDNVFADIGDEQSIEQSLSTFSAHMTHIVKILSEVGENDLLLIDEIGAGTDPEEGAALAMAILEHLMRVGTKVVATTHYSELKTFAYSKTGIENASVEFDIATLRPTYRLLTGIPGTSNAFAISRRLGLADTLIVRAKELIDADHAQFETMLNQLESEKLDYERRNRDIEIRQARIEELERKVNAARDNLERRKEKILQRAQEEGTAMLRRTREASEAIIEDLKAQYNDQGIQKRQAAIDASRRQIREGIGKLAVKQRPKTAMKPIDLAALRPGDTVYVASLDQKGDVVSVSGKDVVVQIGIMKMTVPATSCHAVKESAESVGVSPQPKKKAAMNFAKVHSVGRQIDIRGMMVADAEEVLAKYLDDAVLAGMPEVLIIHGKGTGALRKGIRAYLQEHRNILDIRFAEAAEGGDGATLARLK